MKEFLPNIKIVKYKDYTDAVLTYKHTNVNIAYYCRSRACVGFAPKLYITKKYNREYHITVAGHGDGDCFVWAEDYEQISTRYPDAIKARMKKLAKQVKESFIELAKIEMESDF